MRGLLLKNLRIADAARDQEREVTSGAELEDLRIGRGLVRERGIGLGRRRERVVDLEGYLALPGLINAHDHLDLDLLPWMGEPPYSSFYDWADEIYQPDRPPIKDVLRVPASLRFSWGCYRNLLSGVTTVVHHGDLPRRPLFAQPVSILKRYGWSHSLGFSESVASDFRKARGRPFFIHAAEGVDERAAAEFAQLDAMGVVQQGTVLVHAMVSGGDLDRLASSGASVVWCPGSNQRLYGATAPIKSLMGEGGRPPVLVAIGTDSTISGELSLFDELRIAGHELGIEALDLFDMVTVNAARITRLRDRGALLAGLRADMILVRSDDSAPEQRLLCLRTADLQAVLVAGKPALVSPDLFDAFGVRSANALFDGEPLWVRGPFERLVHKTHSKSPKAVARSPLAQRFKSTVIG